MVEDQADDSIKMTMQSTINGAATFDTVTLTTGIDFWPAAFLLSTILGAVHLTNLGENFMGALEVFVTALLFCLSLRRTGDLWFAVGLHGAWDWAATFLYGVPDSGYQGPGRFSESDVPRAEVAYGVSVGPEGSLVTLAVEMAMMGLVMLRFRVSPKTVQSS